MTLFKSPSNQESLCPVSCAHLHRLPTASPLVFGQGPRGSGAVVVAWQQEATGQTVVQLRTPQTWALLCEHVETQSCFRGLDLRRAEVLDFEGDFAAMSVGWQGSQELVVTSVTIALLGEMAGVNQQQQGSGLTGSTLALLRMTVIPQGDTCSGLVLVPPPRGNMSIADISCSHSTATGVLLCVDNLHMMWMYSRESPSSDYCGPMYPPGYKVLTSSVRYKETEDELDSTSPTSPSTGDVISLEPCNVLDLLSDSISISSVYGGSESSVHSPRERRIMLVSRLRAQWMGGGGFRPREPPLWLTQTSIPTSTSTFEPAGHTALPAPLFDRSFAFPRPPLRLRDTVQSGGAAGGRGGGEGIIWTPPPGELGSGEAQKKLWLDKQVKT